MTLLSTMSPAWCIFKLAGGLQGRGIMGMYPISGITGGRPLAATGNCGVVVIIGNKLTYNKNMNLVKENGIRID